MQMASSTIRTGVTGFLSYDDDYDTPNTSLQKNLLKINFTFPTKDQPDNPQLLFY